jgi:hypothetical protein
MSFDIRQLRYAIAAADHGSFYRAARALDIEQSTLSRYHQEAGTLDWNADLRALAGRRHDDARRHCLHSRREADGGDGRQAGGDDARGRQGRAGGLMLGHNSSVSAGNLRATMMSWRDAHPDVEVAMRRS